ncbi:MAG: archease [Candidatus Aenigmarchaeota archaeon]|nr:archease [Candidatus Aenigmarchaeota archaeon]
MPYKFFDDIAIADVAFESTGRTMEEMFESAGLAVTNTMVKNLDSVKQNVVRVIEVRGDDVGMLLFNFLQEIVFHKDANLLLFSKFNVSITDGRKWKLKARAYGEKLDMKKHELLADVKAVSLHNFKVEKTKDGWKADVILDV